MRWPWWRRKHTPAHRRPDASAATAAREEQQRKLMDAWRLWPDVHAARDELARLAEQAMRGHR